MSQITNFSIAKCDVKKRHGHNSEFSDPPIKSIVDNPLLAIDLIHIADCSCITIIQSSNDKSEISEKFDVCYICFATFRKVVPLGQRNCKAGKLRESKGLEKGDLGQP